VDGKQEIEKELEQENGHLCKSLNGWMTTTRRPGFTIPIAGYGESRSPGRREKKLKNLISLTPRLGSVPRECRLVSQYHIDLRSNVPEKGVSVDRSYLSSLSTKIGTSASSFHRRTGAPSSAGFKSRSRPGSGIW